MSIYTSSRSLADALIDKFKNESLVQVRRYTETTDSGGGFDKSWANFGTAFEAAFIPQSGNELVKSQRVEYHMTHKVYARFADASAVTTKDRFLFRGKEYVIHATKNIAEGDAAWIFDVEEGVS